MLNAGDRHGRRRLGLAAIIALVVAVHTWLTEGLVREMDSLRDARLPGIERMEAEMVADMRLSTPPVVSAPPAPAVAPPVAGPVPVPAASAASAPLEDASQPSTADGEPQAQVPESTASAESASETAPIQASAAASASASHALVAEAATEDAPPPFEWPLATRVTFKVEGYLRGPIYGNAMVEWVRRDMRYQVHIDASVGPSFAPIGSQRWTSEGRITPQGLAPQRFESINRLLIRTAPPRTITFTDTDVTLPDGKQVEPLPGVQDPASHYIQLAYQLMLDPAQLKVGSRIEMPLAWTRRQSIVIYDIEAQETLATPLGRVDTFRLRPRPLPDQKAELLAELWIAPGLQYLPVRMLIRQGAQNYLDMKMDRAPQQAVGAAAADAPAAAASAGRQDRTPPSANPPGAPPQPRALRPEEAVAVPP